MEDAIPANPGLGQNIVFWASQIEAGGTAAGHDYCQDRPDVVTEANALALRWSSKVVVFDTFWTVKRPA